MRVTIRFYEELNDFIKAYPHKQDIHFEFTGRRSVKDLIETFGVPHVEVDLILVNGESVGFEYVVQDEDRISVYPMFERLNISTVSMLNREPLRETRFVLDVHLGRLAKYLLLLGFDTDYKAFRDDPELARISHDEKRILLTRDRGLLMRRIVDHGMIIRHSDPKEQIVEVLDRLDLWEQVKPLTRCMRCGGIIQELDMYSEEFAQIKESIPAGVLKWCKRYFRCSRCGHVVWEGSHMKNMRESIDEVLRRRSED